VSIEMDRQSRRTVHKIENLRGLTRSGVEHAVYTSAKGLQKTINAEILHKPKGGRVYVIRSATGRRRRHRASAPGETHANLTGKLRKSLGFKVNFNQLEYGYGVESKEPAPDYAAGVEFGTKNMAARPSLQNGLRDERRNFQNNFEREIGKRLEGRGFEG